MIAAHPRDKIQNQRPLCIVWLLARVLWKSKVASSTTVSDSRDQIDHRSETYGHLN